jgi:hypothetical protein
VCRESPPIHLGPRGFVGVCCGGSGGQFVSVLPRESSGHRPRPWVVWALFGVCVSIMGATGVNSLACCHESPPRRGCWALVGVCGAIGVIWAFCGFWLRAMGVACGLLLECRLWRRVSVLALLVLDVVVRGSIPGSQIKNFQQQPPKYWLDFKGRSPGDPTHTHTPERYAEVS